MRDLMFRANDNCGNFIFSGVFNRLSEYFDECDMHGWQDQEQYIGRKDNNGQRCYKGDIISAVGYSGWKIVWHHDGWRMQQGDRIENIQFIPDHFNIYSNIHKEE